MESTIRSSTINCSTNIITITTKCTHVLVRWVLNSIFNYKSILHRSIRNPTYFKPTVRIWIKYNFGILYSVSPRKRPYCHYSRVSNSFVIIYLFVYFSQVEQTIFCFISKSVLFGSRKLSIKLV